MAFILQIFVFFVCCWYCHLFSDKDNEVTTLELKYTVDENNEKTYAQTGGEEDEYDNDEYDDDGNDDDDEDDEDEVVEIEETFIYSKHTVIGKAHNQAVIVVHNIK